MKKGSPTVSAGTRSNVAPPQHVSVVGALKDTPILVKVLATDLHLSALWVLGLFVSVAVWGDGGTGTDSFAGLANDSPEVLTGYGLIFAGQVLAMVLFLMGKGIARGARGMWELLLVLNVLAVPFSFLHLREGATVITIVNVFITVATLALLLTPVVRRYCAKR